MLTREQILDRIITVVADKFGLQAEDITRNYTQAGQRANADIAEVKKIVCYLFPLLTDLNYRLLMKRLAYGEKTQARHTRNRKEVRMRMKSDFGYKTLIEGLTEEIKANIDNAIRAKMYSHIEKTDLPVTMTVHLRWKTLTVSANK